MSLSSSMTDLIAMAVVVVVEGFCLLFLFLVLKTSAFSRRMESAVFCLLLQWFFRAKKCGKRGKLWTPKALTKPQFATKKGSLIDYFITMKCLVCLNCFNCFNCFCDDSHATHIHHRTHYAEKRRRFLLVVLRPPISTNREGGDGCTATTTEAPQTPQARRHTKSERP